VNPLLEAALAYVEMGLPVFPVRPRRKEPLVLPELGFLRGLKDATLDPNKVRAAWRLAPEANVGVLPPEGVLVLDGDDPTALQGLFLISPSLASAPRARTGSGGFHLWTRVPPEYARAIPARARAVPGVEVDVRGLGRSYLVAPPSVHPSGGRYVWESPLKDLSALPIPSRELLGLLLVREEPPPRTAPRRAGAASAPRGAGRGRAYALAELRGRSEAMRRTPEGSRHTELVRHAVALWAWVRMGLLEAWEVEESLGSAALEAGLPEREVSGVFSWVRQTSPTRSRIPWEEPAADD